MLQRPLFPRINRNSPLAKGLVFAGLGGGASTLQMVDSSGYGNHGTLTNMDPATDWVWVPELGRWGIGFSGVNNELVQIPKALGDVKTISLWAVQAQGSYVHWTGASWNLKVIRFNTTANATGVVYVQYDGVSPYWSSVPNPKDEAITHFVFQFTPTTVTMFRNGVSWGPKTVSVSFDSPIEMSNPELQPLTGPLADFMAWNRALSPSEIQQLADPSNVLLSGLILPPVRRLWSVSSGAVFTEPMDRWVAA